MKMGHEEERHREMAMHRGGRSLLINLFGLLSAFVMAFGGLALVQRQLGAEKQKILESGGAVLVSVQQMEAEASKETQTAPKSLTEQELFQALEVLGREGEACPHELQPGQLSMAQAAECGKAWMNEFLLPRLELPVSEGGGEEKFQAACFLWTKGDEDAEDALEDPFRSFWSVSLDSDRVNAMLLLSAATGQVLNAAVSYLSSEEYQEYLDDKGMLELLEDYADSFGMESEYPLLEQGAENRWTLRHSFGGDKEISATVMLGSIVAETSDYAEYADYLEVKEYVYIRLYLEAGEKINPVPW